MKRRNLYIAVFISFLVIALIYWLASANKRYSWRENYRHDNEGPYGTFVVQKLFENAVVANQFFVVEEPISQVLALAEDSSAAYIFIGDDMYIDSLSAEALLGFVEQGNQAFLISRSMPYAISAALIDDIYCSAADFRPIRYYWNDSVSVHS